ncbi:WD repeat-containing protein 54-like isoform X1 [Lytechinus pictus]|uniref:WD repeat-containing protein 54-like isoform X1 n=1 Tax=Lytechinus pictus TaxID=7653 RepID=UPI00240DD28B|nr:WD repeat-containing protein 54-like isoform X1 [Lytechinus pictus]
MYHKSKSVHLKSSASLRYNNLSVLCSPERNVTCYAVVHKAVVNISNCAGDGAGSGVGPNVTQRQLHCKDVAGVTQNAAILEAKFCELPSRTLMVVCCQKGVQMFEPDSSALVFWHALFNSDGNDGFLFTRGIASVLDSFIAVGAAFVHDRESPGTSTGSVLVFSIPSRGTNVQLSETLSGHSYPISAVAGAGDMMASGDDSGCIMVWQAGPKFYQLTRINGGGATCSSLCLYKNLVIGGYGTGHIRIFDTQKGNLMTEICAHAKWIHAMDLAPSAGLLMSTSEDTMLRVWSLKADDNQAKVSLAYQECITDIQLCGAKFLDKEGHSFCVSGYDAPEVVCFTKG